MTRRLLATGTRLQGQPPTLRTDMNTTDIYMPRSAYALPPLPGEHLEAVELDMTTSKGAIVLLGGRVSVWEPTRVIFVDVIYASSLDRKDAADALRSAISDGRIGSDVVRAAVERGFDIRGYGDREWSYTCESGRVDSANDALTITVDRHDIDCGRATLTMTEADAAYDEDGNESDAETHITLSPEALESLASDVPAECEVERARR